MLDPDPDHSAALLASKSHILAHRFNAVVVAVEYSAVCHNGNVDVGSEWRSAWTLVGNTMARLRRRYHVDA